ncbi:hypothetical protein BABINDRAFT_90105 [Babjeviella inositovora NRRL Y-12698]|uniref:PIN domain-containing protein n=1 Tax=Babjeviella inositovora NRRL Y-12698 TaxID=984486 RepID=A0A1E3QKX2_9ASCO|nr:uncharacterized protein BABINDRAFT_90105 [Babjeviella inositovora NRRL Y-12698]ODQ78333.1 hypothetical protein BABINDRAFT_90105 [Babjeviella inositovora NRRL Y-12698]
MASADPLQLFLILDSSAFVRGIGNIKRWIGDFNVVVFIPAYTLHELDYVKKGISMLATNARESIRYIDKATSCDFDTVPLRVFIEGPDEAGPKWPKCMKYKVHAPLIREFPNQKTTFDSNLIGHNMNNHAVNLAHYSNDIEYEGDSLAGQPKPRNTANHKAEMPTRLRYLIRSCIQKVHIDRQNNWKLVTEDPITSIWCQSFGIDCLSINQAEHDIFAAQGLSAANLYVPKPQNRLGGGYSISPLVEDDRTKSDKVKKEKFNAMSYAPRGVGKLWTP